MAIVEAHVALGPALRRQILPVRRDAHGGLAPELGDRLLHHATRSRERDAVEQGLPRRRIEAVRVIPPRLLNPIPLACKVPENARRRVSTRIVFLHDNFANTPK